MWIELQNVHVRYRFLVGDVLLFSTSEEAGKSLFNHLTLLKVCSPFVNHKKYLFSRYKQRGIHAVGLESENKD